ncbi:Cupin 2 conserved barrel domain protein [Candidatus Methylobacter favarea]|uniref:Cupin 2 conserved barrel domain protein n=1 Tax=Candidatus Methylobacter favarea TaxID=2707345 RepID=A0A8S0XUZ2_9GAMM|nr:cupin domain-containing protein [Candidatus Methylobacter favarea]CAA9892528.1 Cupin 2 conserved barrel domain protein [Candidatus Methylobacter favarea]
MFRTQLMKITGYFCITLTALFSIGAEAVSAEEKPALDRTILLENKVELPGNRVNAKLIRVTFPSAFKTPWHTHQGPGPRYIVKGKLKVVENGKTNVYCAGEVFWESGSLLSVENIGEDSAEIIIFELAPVN